MALSSWDCLAFDSEGKPSNGVIETPEGASVQIYKNWLYVSNPKLWYKGCGFSEHVIADIQHGSIDISGFKIEAIRRDEQESVFCFVKYNDRYMAGIGCYGFKSDKDWLEEKHPDIYSKIDSKYWNRDKFLLGTFHQGDSWGYSWWDKEQEVEFKLIMTVERPTLDERWTGVKPSTVKAFFDWLEELSPEKYFSKQIGKIQPRKRLFC